jgi:hypothetical protein
MSDRTEKTAWISRVLGVDLADQDSPLRPAVLPIWTEARQTVDTALDSLDAALRKVGHPDFDRIAGAGLARIRKQLNAGPAKALAALDAAPQDAWEARAKPARRVIAALRNVLSANRALPLLDANPLGVQPALTATLSAAIAGIEARLAR